MQINNDYTSHHHHITECHFEEPLKKKTGGGPSPKSSAGAREAAASLKEEEYLNVFRSADTKTSGGKKVSAARGFWEALGDEGAGSEKSVMTIFKEHFLTEVHEAALVFQAGFKHQVTDRIQTVRERIKVSAGNALGKFKRNRESFAALMGKKSSAGREKYRSGAESSKGQVTDTKPAEDIPMQILPESYLMDSYNRKGEYSRLNDNLTYRKPDGPSERQMEK